MKRAKLARTLRCPIHQCDLVHKPWIKRRKRAADDVLVCLACVAKARAKAQAEIAQGRAVRNRVAA